MSAITGSTAGDQTIAKESLRPNGAAARRARAKAVDRTMTVLLWILTGLIVAVLAYFIGYTIQRGIGVINWQFITSENITGDYDGPEVFNSFYILIAALIVCVPFGIAAAVYLREYARQNLFTTLVRFATETLAGVPS